MGKSSGSIWVSLGLKTSEFTKGIKKAKGQLNGFQKFGQGLKGMFNPMTVGIGVVAGLGAALVDAAGTIKDFEKANSNLKAVLDKTDTGLAMLTQQAKDLGASTAFTAMEVSGLQKELAKLGFNSSQIENMTEATLNLAAAAGVELSEAATFAGASLNAFGLQSTDAGHITDVMALSFASSALDMEKLSETMKTAAPIARATGVSFEVATAAAGKLADANITGSKAGTDLKNIFSELVKDGKPFQQSLSDISKKLNGASTKAEKLAIAEKLVGERAKGSLLILANQKDALGELATEFEGADGAAKKMADTMLDNLAGDVTKAGSAWEGLILSVEDGSGVLSDGARAIVKFGTEVLGFFTDLNKGGLDAESSMKRVGNQFLKMSAFGSFQFDIPLDKITAFESKLKQQNVTQLNTAKGINMMVSKYKEMGLSSKEAATRTKDFIDSINPVKEVMPKVTSLTEGAAASVVKLTKAQEKAAAASVAMKKEQLANAGAFETVKTKALNLSETLGSIKVKPIELKLALPSSQTWQEMAAGMSAGWEQMNLEAKAAEFQKIQDTAAGVSAGIQEAFGGIGASVVASMGEATSGMDMFKQKMVQFALDLIAQALSVSISNAIIGATAAGAAAGPAAPFVTPGLIASSIGTVFGAFASIPAFADGGIVSGPTMGLMGEYAGAKSNPEVIAPLDKLKSLIGQDNGMGGSVEFEIKGTSLVGILKRTGKNASYSN